MRAVSCLKGELRVVDLPAPSPGEGQVLLDVVRCGICGSDVHARYHCDDLADVAAETGYDDFMRMSDEVVMGHEFSGRIAAYGPGTRKKIDVGAPVVALPLLRTNGKGQAVGLSKNAPGGYAEQVLVDELLMMPVPAALDPAMAALTEPMAIGLHAVRRGEVKKNDVAIVIGCGPIGLAVICALKASGVKTVVASDFSAARRRLATVCGADLVVDPAVDAPYAAAGDRGHLTTFNAAIDMLLDAMKTVRRLPLPWHHVMRTAEKLGAGPKAPVIFECVGVPGIIDSVMAAAPMRSRVVVVGVCMGPDRIRPSMAINKEIELRFVLGYSPVEFRDTLHMLADKTLNATPLVTGTVGLDGVESAFTALADPESHAKVLIDPASSAALE
jgi:threonine dehydrogenase-like Zn-dependent dehydrogenase